MSGTEGAAVETPAIDRLVSKLRAARAQGGGVEFLVDADSAAALLGEIAALRFRAAESAWRGEEIDRLIGRLAEAHDEAHALRKELLACRLSPPTVIPAKVFDPNGPGDVEMPRWFPLAVLDGAARFALGMALFGAALLACRVLGWLS
jgi:hypothetical protein